MGAAGTDVALESADVALMADELDRLPDAVAHRRARCGSCARTSSPRSRQGACSSSSPRSGLVTLVMAVAADMGMSLLVTLNALRLLRLR